MEEKNLVLRILPCVVFLDASSYTTVITAVKNDMFDAKFLASLGLISYLVLEAGRLIKMIPADLTGLHLHMFGL